MITSSVIKKLKNQLQAEVDAHYLYRILSEDYKDELVKQVFIKLSAIEGTHAKKFLDLIHQQDLNYLMPEPSWRARFQVFLSKYIGTDFILANLAGLESQITNTLVKKKQKEGEKITGLENLHLNILQNVAQQRHTGVRGKILSKFEGKHKFVGGNVLRAAVLGANDGLVSNLSLMMGVSGATNNHREVLIAGISGLLAGAISMAMGEWLSVQSSRELYQRQVEIEAQELETSPEEELNELALLYEAKGIEEIQAKKLANEVFANKETALDSLLREELGIDKETLGGSAHFAAIVSFLLFAFGAIIPILPLLFWTDSKAMINSLVFSVIALFFIGAAITLVTERNIFYSGTRQVIFGLVASGITFLIGKLIAQIISIT